ncbi:hypothetical protein CCUS01_06300 [Colletotrichum cuscutae]|uniref:DUF1996 domain-containing protein n=1 Tax=Colletotrichum cuscutae TaxID=1209917 RepID=A0AAI9V6H3_9PEZI|nr:hypothetical protein CCUS01_06300 [Colletotrichum cuscutae]
MKFANILAVALAAGAYTVTIVNKFMYKNIDPVVIPGQYASHMHTFLGSDAVTLNTTTSKEVAGCATAVNPNDYSSYFSISRFSAYYVAIEKAEVAIPQDYKAVVGNASAKSEADTEPLAGIQWFCEGGPSAGKDVNGFPSKTCNTHLQTILLFHDCVNQETLESTYSGTQHWTATSKPANRCPLDMKRMPQLRFSIRYDLRKALPDGWEGTAPLVLACGPAYCTHGDFINGWLPEAAVNMLLANSKRDFAGVDGPAGKYSAGSVCGAQNATDADPENGTSDYLTSKQILQRLIDQKA